MPQNAAVTRRLVDTALASRIGNVPGAVEAHQLQEALNAQGIDCYVRCWHLGQCGWFVVDAETYERLNFPPNAEVFPSLSMRNRKLVLQALRSKMDCGCYACAATFAPYKIANWTDDGATALCPYCDCDAVVVGVTDSAALVDGAARWFAPEAVA